MYVIGDDRCLDSSRAFAVSSRSKYREEKEKVTHTFPPDAAPFSPEQGR